MNDVYKYKGDDFWAFFEILTRTRRCEMQVGVSIQNNIVY